MSRRLTVAVVGLGIGRSHLEAYATLPQLFEIKAICDLDTAKCQAAAIAYGAPVTTARFADLMAMTGSTSSISARRPTRITA